MINWIKDRLSASNKQKIRELYHHLFKGRNHLYCRIHGIQIGTNCRFYGLPFFQSRKKGSITIGSGFIAASKMKYNSLGVQQRVCIKASTPSATITIGHDVGISGSSIAAKREVKIGNDVLIGTGCLITDSDAHPILPADRKNGKDPEIKPVRIEDEVFIGARSIILKGVTIGKGSVIGAGSVVVKDIPPGVVASGNPARIIREHTAESS